MGDFSRALKALPTVNGATSSSTASLNLRGIAQLVNGEAEKSLATFEEALKSDPSNAEARFNHGVALLKLQRYAEAAEAFRQLAEAKEGRLQAAAAYHCAVALDQAGDQAGAEQWLGQALTLDPELDSAHLYLGVVREKQQNFAPAAEAYKEYLRRNPESLVAMLRFGVCAHRAGYLDTARKYLQQVVGIAPNSIEAAEAQKFLVMYD